VEDKEIRDQFLELQARSLAIRDVVTRLLAYESTKWDDPPVLFNDISETTAKRIYDLLGKRSSSSRTILFQELLQKEVDMIVTMAREMAKPEDEP